MTPCSFVYGLETRVFALESKTTIRIIVFYIHNYAAMTAVYLERLAIGQEAAPPYSATSIGEELLIHTTSQQTRPPRPFTRTPITSS